MLGDTKDIGTKGWQRKKRYSEGASGGEGSAKWQWIKTGRFYQWGTRRVKVSGGEKVSSFKRRDVPGSEQESYVSPWERKIFAERNTRRERLEDHNSKTPLIHVQNLLKHLQKNICMCYKRDLIHGPTITGNAPFHTGLCLSTPKP